MLAKYDSFSREASLTRMGSRLWVMPLDLTFLVSIVTHGDVNEAPGGTAREGTA